MRFVCFHLVWFSSWILLNLFLPQAWRWDPTPFPFLTLIVSLEAIFLVILILIAENHDAALAERREHLNLQINLLTEQENTRMLHLLERIAVKLGVPGETNPEAEALRESLQPEKLLHQIDQRLRRDKG